MNNTYCNYIENVAGEDVETEEERMDLVKFWEDMTEDYIDNFFV